MFNDLVVQPIFNLLVFVYALLPGHNFGLALIIFTIIIRILLWPLVKKQLHQTKVMRKLQPEITKIKQATKGNRQKESMMLMELYKERGINPLASLPTLIVQLVVLLGLYIGLQKVVKDPQQLIDFSYPVLRDNLGWLKQLNENIALFDNSLFGVVDLSKAAIGPGGFYFGAFILVAGSALAQYVQAKQLLPETDQKRGLRVILKEASEGKQADQSEMSAVVSRKMVYLLPAVVFIFTINLPAALSLYWLVGGVVAYIQQSRVLNQDEAEMETMGTIATNKKLASIPEAEVVEDKTTANTQKVKKSKKGNKRRKR